MLQTLYENPWPTTLTLIAMGVILFFVGQRRANGRMLVAGTAMFVLAGGSLLLAGYVETDRESINKATRQLLDRTAPLDVQALGEMLDEACTLSVADRGPQLSGSMVIRTALYTAVQRYRVKSHIVRELESDFIEPHFGKTQLRIHTVFEDGQHAVTRWELSWQRDAAGRWKVTDLRLLELNNAPPGNVLSSI